mmetsp:Transcript_98273/g.315885  ORF Transcript_98273/g.315885 Transcript_98273/m.315885 type:complete len:202 (-) Transcript_98273:1025-1630(-)
MTENRHDPGKLTILPREPDILEHLRKSGRSSSSSEWNLEIGLRPLGRFNGEAAKKVALRCRKEAGEHQLQQPEGTQQTQGKRTNRREGQVLPHKPEASYHRAPTVECRSLLFIGPFLHKGYIRFVAFGCQDHRLPTIHRRIIDRTVEKAGHPERLNLRRRLLRMAAQRALALVDASDKLKVGPFARALLRGASFENGTRQH